MIYSEVKIKVKISIFGDQKKTKLKSNFAQYRIFPFAQILTPQIYFCIRHALDYEQFQKIISQHFISSDDLIYLPWSRIISRYQREKKTCKNIDLDVGQFMNDIKQTSFKLLSCAFLAKCLCTEYQVVWFDTVGNIKLNYI